MTAQAGDILIYKSKKYSMATEPLESYFDLVGSRPELVSPMTNCWRGYFSTWKIKYKKLFLVHLVCFVDDSKPVRMEYLFPDQKEVFAGWFSGEIRVPQGKLLKYIHMGYASTFEKDLFLDFKYGVLVGTRVVENKIPENDGRIKLGFSKINLPSKDNDLDLLK
jgi:hypothetical protein